MSKPESQRPVGTVWQTHHGVPYGMWQGTGKIERMFAEGKLYEQPLLEWIHDHTENLPLNSVALDVGANIGNHTLWMGAVCGLIVHAFEPVIPNVVAANWHLNVHSEPDNVTVHPCGLGVRPGTYHHVGKGVLRPGLSKESTDEIVEIRTLDSFGFENVDFIKIDVEGMEASVLLSGVNTLRRCKPTLAIEAWTAADMNDQHKVLDPLGYTLTGTQFGGRGRAPVHIWKVEA